MSSRHRVAASVFCAAVFLAATAHGQAWVGLERSLSLSLDYNYGFSNKIIQDFSDRSNEPDGENIAHHAYVVGAEYVPLDKLALRVTIPVISTIYSGSAALFPRHGRYDDGSHHTTLQDFSMRARYQVYDDIVAFSPHLGFSLPMTDYETVGYAGAGRGLRSLEFGGSVGKFFLSGVPGLFVHGSYSLNLVERYKTAFEETADFGQNNSRFDLQTGYFILPQLQVHVAGDLRLAHGGFEFANYDDYAEVSRMYHDPLMAEDVLLLGGGASYSILHNLSVNAMFRVWTWGHNTRNAHMVGAGLNWNVL